VNPQDRARQAEADTIPGDTLDALDTVMVRRAGDPEDPDDLVIAPPEAGFAHTEPGTAGRPKLMSLCVDDVGLHPGATLAGLDLALSGRAQGLACRVGTPAWALAAGQITRLRALNVDVGLLLDLTEHPLNSAVARPRINWLLGTGLPREAAVREEVAAQIDTFEQALGQPPAFIAGHRHVHQFSSLRGLVIEEMLERYRSTNLPWVRQGRRGGKHPWQLPSALRAWGVERTGARALARAARDSGIGHNRALLGIYDGRANVSHYQALLQEWVRAGVEGDVLVCHPIAPLPPGEAAAMHLSAAHLASGQAEHSAISGGDWATLLERTAVELTPMPRLMARRNRD
jgi:chitin disaccharide deacetylase